MRRRPRGMYIDRDRCIECGLCEVFTPGMSERTDIIAITESTLEAMASCPVGAIRWDEEGHVPREP